MRIRELVDRQEECLITFLIGFYLYCVSVFIYMFSAVRGLLVPVHIRCREDE